MSRKPGMIFDSIPANGKVFSNLNTLRSRTAHLRLGLYRGENFQRSTFRRYMQGGLAARSVIPVGKAYAISPNKVLALSLRALECGSFSWPAVLLSQSLRLTEWPFASSLDLLIS